MSFEGTLCKFGFSALLTTLTTALVLVTSASTIVTYMALYLFKASAKYTLLMYQYSEDFTAYKDHVANKKKERVDYASGELLLKKAAAKSLTEQEIYTLFLDHEFRMNKLDGRDPQLAFESADKREAPLTKPMVDIHEKFMKDFYDGQGGAE